MTTRYYTSLIIIRAILCRPVLLVARLFRKHHNNIQATTNYGTINQNGSIHATRTLLQQVLRDGGPDARHKTGHPEHGTSHRSHDERMRGQSRTSGHGIFRDRGRSHDPEAQIDTRGNWLTIDKLPDQQKEITIHI